MDGTRHHHLLHQQKAMQRKQIVGQEKWKRGGQTRKGWEALEAVGEEPLAFKGAAERREDRGGLEGEGIDVDEGDTEGG